MDVKVNAEGTKAVFAVDGKLTVQTSSELEEVIGKLDASICDIDFDLADVTYISSAGLRVLVAANKLAVKRGGAMRLLHPIDEVMDILEMTGLSEVFTIER